LNKLQFAHSQPHGSQTPVGLRTDNGVPFASPNSLFNLSKLSVWWLRLGIGIERIKPGDPVCTENLNSGVAVVKAAQDGRRFYAPSRTMTKA
jgi:hypothetical protein